MRFFNLEYHSILICVFAFRGHHTKRIREEKNAAVGSLCPQTNARWVFWKLRNAYCITCSTYEPSCRVRPKNKHSYQSFYGLIFLCDYEYRMK